MDIFEKALECIFLPSCGICGKLGEGYLCKNCEKELGKYVINLKRNFTNSKKNMEINILLKEYKHDDNFPLQYKKVKNGSKSLKNRINKFHVFKYEDLVRKLIIQYKFNDKSYLYKMFCEFIVKNKKSFDFINSYDIILPVPIHRKRMKQRGYNQSELIARELAKNVKIKCYADIIVKIKNNKPQSTLSGKLRKENTKNVYKLNNFEKIENKKILIFDDIYTTGATVDACIRELKNANVAEIGVLTLAKD